MDDLWFVPKSLKTIVSAKLGVVKTDAKANAAYSSKIQDANQAWTADQQQAWASAWGWSGDIPNQQQQQPAAGNAWGAQQSWGAQQGWGGAQPQQQQMQGGWAGSW